MLISYCFFLVPKYISSKDGVGFTNTNISINQVNSEVFDFQFKNVKNYFLEYDYSFPRFLYFCQRKQLQKA